MPDRFKNGHVIDEADFINEAEASDTPSNDADKLVRLEADGKLAKRFQRLELIWSFEASENLKHSADTERTEADTTFVLKKSIKLNRGGTVRVKFDLRHNAGGGASAEGRVYIDGVAVGTTRNNGTTTYVTYTEDFTIKEFSSIQLYLRRVSSGSAIARNFRIYYDLLDTLPNGSVVQD